MGFQVPAGFQVPVGFEVPAGSDSEVPYCEISSFFEVLQAIFANSVSNSAKNVIFFTVISGEGRLPYAFPHTGPYSFSVWILQNT